MKKVGRPEGLIAYDSLKNFERRKIGEKNQFRIIRPRTIIYSFILGAVGVIMLYALLNRSLLDVNILRDRNPLFVQLSSGDIRNGYTIKIMNKSTSDQKYSINLEGLNDFNIRSENVSEYTETGAPIVSVQRDKLQSVKFYVSTPLLNLVDDSVDVTFTIKELESGETDIQSTTFKGPKK
jgi:polyferredoxin